MYITGIPLTAFLLLFSWIYSSSNFHQASSNKTGLEDLSKKQRSCKINCSPLLNSSIGLRAFIYVCREINNEEASAILGSIVQITAFSISGNHHQSSYLLHNNWLSGRLPD